MCRWYLRYFDRDDIANNSVHGMSVLYFSQYMSSYGLGNACFAFFVCRLPAVAYIFVAGAVGVFVFFVCVSTMFIKHDLVDSISKDCVLRVDISSGLWRRLLWQCHGADYMLGMSS